MGSFLADYIVMGGVTISATGGILCTNNIAITAGSGAAQSINSLSGYCYSAFATTNSLILISGNLVSTSLSISSLSGVIDERLISTGILLYALVSGISGNIQLTGSNLQGQINTFTTNLTNTGVALYALTSGINGNLTQSGIQLQVIIGATGGTLYILVTSLSGQANVNYATVTNLGSTGQQVWNAANSNGINLSGALTQSGIQLMMRDAATSGALDIRIIGTGNIAIVQANSIGTTLSGNLTSTGLQIGLISGGLETRLAATGGSAINHANSIGVTISGNITQTGVQVQTIIAATGAGLYVMLTGTSGQANVNYATVINLTATGQQAWNAANNNGVNLSGGLALSHDLPICFNTASITWTNMPLAVNFLNASTLYITYADLSACTGINLIVNKQAVFGAPSGGLMVRYLGNSSFIASSYLPITNPEIYVRCGQANTIIQSGFSSIVAGARSGVYLALMGISGSGAGGPIFGNIIAHFK